MEKRIFILLVCFFIITEVSNAQVKKVYAYKQANIPGTVIGSDDGDIKEKNALKREPSHNFNYWFFSSGFGGSNHSNEPQHTGYYFNGVSCIGNIVFQAANKTRPQFAGYYCFCVAGVCRHTAFCCAVHF